MARLTGANDATFGRACWPVASDSAARSLGDVDANNAKVSDNTASASKQPRVRGHRARRRCAVAYLFIIAYFQRLGRAGTYRAKSGVTPVTANELTRVSNIN
jgi:hypothetical protein